MKLFFDTSVLIEVERKNPKVLALFERIIEKHEILISTITVSELFVGCFLTKTPEKSEKNAIELLSQFTWIDFDFEAAYKTGRILAEKLNSGKPVGYQDSAIIASFLSSKSDFLITNNIKHFEGRELEKKVFTPQEFLEKIEAVES